MIVDFFKEIWTEFKDYVLPFIIISEYDMAARLRMGKNPTELGPGIHFKIPFLDIVYVCNTQPDTKETTPIYVTTADEKTITATPFIKFRIVDAVKYLIYTNTADSNLHDTAKIVFSDYLTDITWEECKKKTTRTNIKNKLNVETEDMGIEILKCGLSGLAITRLIITQIDGKKDQGK